MPPMGEKSLKLFKDFSPVGEFFKYKCHNFTVKLLSIHQSTSSRQFSQIYLKVEFLPRDFFFYNFSFEEKNPMGFLVFSKSSFYSFFY